MPNKNYKAGRRMEYDRMNFYKEHGFSVVRSAGSHGIWDLCAVNPGYSVALIQCKIVNDETTMRRLLKNHYENPPLPTSQHYKQVLEVRVKGSKTVHSATI